MITEGMLTEIGEIFKPHGIKGEVSAALDEGLEPTDVPCLFIDRDGIFVPFYVAEARQRGPESWLIRFDGVNDENQASEFSRAVLYALTSDLPFDDDDLEDGEERIYLSDLSDCKVYNGDTLVGTVSAVDDSTENILLVIRPEEGGHDIYVPFVDDYILEADIQAKKIRIDVPESLLNLN